jgi:hypothetical protein
MQACYMYLQMDLLDNWLTTCPIQMGRGISITPYPNQRFRFTDDPDRQSGTSSVPTQTWTRSDGPEPLLTLALLNNMQDATHCTTIYRGTRQCIKHMSRNKTYTSDELLYTLELCIYRGIKAEVEGLEGERIPQRCPCTGSQR